MSGPFELIRRMVRDKREYRQIQARVKVLPEEYGYVYDRIRRYMFNYVAGSGMDTVQILYDLLALFEEGAAEGKHVLEITGEDVAAFSDELLRNARTYTGTWRESLNRDIMERIGKKGGVK